MADFPITADQQRLLATALRQILGEAHPQDRIAYLEAMNARLLKLATDAADLNRQPPLIMEKPDA